MMFVTQNNLKNGPGISDRLLAFYLSNGPGISDRLLAFYLSKENVVTHLY